MSIYLMFLSIGVHLLYYGIQFSLKSIGDKWSLNALFIGIADTIGYASSGN